MDDTWWDRMKARLWRPVAFLRRAFCAHEFEVSHLPPGWSGSAWCRKCESNFSIHCKGE